MLLLVAGGSSTVVKFGEFIMILELHRQGLKVAAIARQQGPLASANAMPNFTPGTEPAMAS
jgi:hypothetical protein